MYISPCHVRDSLCIYKKLEKKQIIATKNKYSGIIPFGFCMPCPQFVCRCSLAVYSKDKQTKNKQILKYDTF